MQLRPGEGRSKVKIGLFTDTFAPEINGVASSCLTLERALTSLGHEVHVYAPRCRGWEAHRREKIHYVPSAPLAVLHERNVAFPTLLEGWEAGKLDFDVVHTNSEFVMGFFGRRVARHTGCALVHTYHTVWEDYAYYLTHGHADTAARRLTRRYSQWWCDRFDRVIVPTEKTLALLRRYGVEAEIDVIPSGMDAARFAPARHSGEERLAVRAACGVQPGERVLLSVGRIAKEKNIERVVRVFPRLLCACPDVRLVVVGEGPQRAELEQLAESLGVAARVSFVGPKPWQEIDRYYAIGDVFASASRSETQGLTYIEAMAAGLCVCAVRDACLDGVIEDGRSGVLTQDSDEAFCAGLVRAFSPEGRKIAAAAPGYAAPFGMETFARRVEDCYKAAIRAARGGDKAPDLCTHVTKTSSGFAKTMEK